MAKEKSDVFAAIADETRRAILMRLARDGALNVSALAEPFSISQPAISRHLRILREAGLIRGQKQGRGVFYEIRGDQLIQVRDWVAHFEKHWDEKLDALGQYLEERSRKKGR